jgi:hypothetical protein
MFYLFLANVVVLIHFIFILFVIFGGFLLFKWVRCAWIHLPVVIYGALLEFFGWICPLTPLEKWLRLKGGGAAYETGFIDHYIVPIIYPSNLTRQLQITLGLFVLALNLGIYLAVIWFRVRKKYVRKSSDA